MNQEQLQNEGGPRRPSTGNRERGFLKVYRSVFDADDPLWREDRPRTAWEARLDLLRMVHFQAEVVELVVRGRVMLVRRGEVIVQERRLAERWGWSRSKVRRFLGKLEALGTIARVPPSEGVIRSCERTGPGACPGTAPPCTHLRFCNYAHYAGGAVPRDPQCGPDGDPKAAQDETDPRTREGRETKNPDRGHVRERAAARPEPAAKGDAVFTFDADLLRGAGDGPWHVTPGLHGRFTEAFPDLDIDGEYRRAAAWLESNPGRRKTRGGMARFLNNWLERAQNARGARHGGADTAEQRGLGPRHFSRAHEDADVFAKLEEADRARLAGASGGEGRS